MKASEKHPDRLSEAAEYLGIGPGVFVRPPYIQCPRCGEEAFGIICIAAHQYSRRCRICLYPTPPERHEPTRLPRLDKKTLYLDQFVISKMMFALNSATRQHGRDSHESFYREAFSRLDVLGKKQLVICPSSEFHRLESLTSQCSEPLERMYKLLGYGAVWYDSDFVRKALIMEAFGLWESAQPRQRSRLTKDDFLRGDRSAWTPCFEVSVNMRCEPVFIEEIRQARDASDEGIRLVFERWQGDQDKTFNDWIREETHGAAKRYISGFSRHVANAVALQAETSGRQDVSLNSIAMLLPSHEVEIMMRLRHALMARGYNEGEWPQKARLFLESEYFAQLPFVEIGSLIWATVAHRSAHSGRKRPPTRGFSNDVQLIATYLPYCDAMFLDRECHGILDDRLMRDALAKYGTRIFSLRNKDEFLSYLGEIERGASPEHLRFLSEVYGEQYLKPYLGLYDTVARPGQEQHAEGRKDSN